MMVVLRQEELEEREERRGVGDIGGGTICGRSTPWNGNRKRSSSRLPENVALCSRTVRNGVNGTDEEDSRTPPGGRKQMGNEDEEKDDEGKQGKGKMNKFDRGQTSDAF